MASLAAEVEDHRESMVDGLRELWGLSETLLSKVLPTVITSEAIEEVRDSLLQSPRRQKDVLAQYTKLKAAMSIYPGTPINVATANLEIFGLTNETELIEGTHQPDDVLYRANLAHAVGIFVEKLISNIEDLDLEEMLDMFSHALFSQILKSSNTKTIGSTSLLAETFQLALELRTQVFCFHVRDSQESSQNFDVSNAISEFFYDGSAKLAGWNIPGLESQDLSKPQRKAISQRVKDIRQTLASYDENDPESPNLNDRFPIIDVVRDFFKWAQDRNTELVDQIDNDPNGILTIQAAIDEHVQALKSRQEPGDMIKLNIGPSDGFAVPAKPSKATNKKSVGPNVLHMMRMSLPRPQSSAATSVVTAQTHQRPTKELLPSVENYEEEGAMTFVGDEIGENPGPLEDEQFASPYPPLDNVEMLSQAVSRSDRNANKENRPHRPQRVQKSYLDPQSQAQEIPWSDSPVTIDKGKRRRVEEEPVEQEEDNEQDSEDDFETQRSPASASKKRQKTTSKRQTTYRQTTAPRSPLADARHGNQRSGTSGINVNTPFPGTQSHKEANAAAKDIKARLVTGKRQVRHAWTEEETECLIDYIADDAFETRWSQIKRDDDQGEQILTLRDQVGLKDKARNIKMDYLKSHRQLPKGFHKVAITTIHRKELAKLGMIYDDELGDVTYLPVNHGSDGYEEEE